MEERVIVHPTLHLLVDALVQVVVQVIAALLHLVGVVVLGLSPAELALRQSFVRDEVQDCANRLSMCHLELLHGEVGVEAQ